MNFRFEYILYLLAGVLAYLLTGCEFISAAGISISVAAIAAFVKNCNYHIPVNDLFIAIAGLQWIIGPFLAYHGFNEHYKYHMYVDEATYMYLAVPGVVAFWLGFSVFRRESQTEIIEASINEVKEYTPQIGYLLILAGVVLSFATAYVPGSLRFVFYLLGLVKYIGILYLLFGESKRKWLVIAIAFVLTFLSSLQSAMFHNLLLWSVMLGMYILYYLKLNVVQKITLVFAGVLFIFTIQIVKAEFRKMVWAGAIQGQEVSTFRSMVTDEYQSGNFLSYGNMEDMVVRINQGWIVSRIMFYTPTYSQFANGSTVKDAVKATLLPRILVPDKKIAGGKENYERFTGYTLWAASMGISLLGEGYANFGVHGAWVFMFFAGLFFSFMLHLVISLSRNYPSLILWLPLIFLQVVKAETELIVVLNHLVKSAFLVFLIFLGARKFFGLRL